MMDHMRDGRHFESVSSSYGDARPPYPPVLYETLADHGVIGLGRRILEIGAGSGQATTELIRRGCEVVAVEPGPSLAAQLERACPEAVVLNDVVENVELPESAFDAAVAATSMHWVDVPTILPRLRQWLVPDGILAVWRTVFGDPRQQTAFRSAVEQIVARRGTSERRSDPLDPPPTVGALEAGDAFRLLASWQWPWQAALDAKQLRALFATFSDWQDPAELDAVQAAAAAQPGPVTEHYVTVLHLLRSADASDGGAGGLDGLG